MNVMNVDERVLGIRESLCFVGGFGAVLGAEGAVWALSDITNALAAPKKWFIEVHLLHCPDKLPYLLSRLMNLMNLDELGYYSRLSFAMGKRDKRYPETYQVHCSSFGSLNWRQE